MMANEKSEVVFNNCLKAIQSETEQRCYHRLWPLLLIGMNCIKINPAICQSQDFNGQLMQILRCCQLLDGIASDYDYRLTIANEVFKPIITVLEETSANHAKTIKEFINVNMPFYPYGKNNLKKLKCFYSAATPFDPIRFDKFHRHMIDIDINNQMKYTLISIAETLLSYWNDNRKSSHSWQRLNNFSAIMSFGERLLNEAQHELDETRNRRLFRAVLLLSKMFYDHPQLTLVENVIWPPRGFVRTLKNNNGSLDMSSTCPLYNFADYKKQLANSRVLRPYDNVLEYQQQHSSVIIEILNDLYREGCDLLGKPPCQLALCAVGSTARGDRRPFSDIELFLLHSECDNNAELERYIYYLLSYLEMHIINLGETPSEDDPNGGFRIDRSFHVMRLKLWGTSKDLIKRFIKHKLPDIDQNTADAHMMYAMLTPVQINNDNQLLKSEYIKRLNRTFAKHPPICTSSSYPMQARTAVALIALRQILNKSVITHGELAPAMFINIKETYYKPLTYLAHTINLCSKPLGEVNAPIRIIENDHLPNVWSTEFITWWRSALRFLTKEMIDLHFKFGYQEEVIEYRLENENDQEFWLGMHLIFAGFISPLNDLIEAILQGKTTLESLGKNIFQHYIQCRRAWFNEALNYAQINKRILLKHPLLLLFQYQRDSSGWKPADERVHWDFCESLRKLQDDKLPSPCQLLGGPWFDAHPIQRHLKLDYFKKLEFNEAGEFIKQYGRLYLSYHTDIVIQKCYEPSSIARLRIGTTLAYILGDNRLLPHGTPLILYYRRSWRAKTANYVWVSCDNDDDEDGIERFPVSSLSCKVPIRLAKNASNYSHLFFWCYLVGDNRVTDPANIIINEISGKTEFPDENITPELYFSLISYKNILMEDHPELVNNFNNYSKSALLLFAEIDAEIPRYFVERILALDANAVIAHIKIELHKLKANFEFTLSNAANDDKLFTINPKVLTQIKQRLVLLQTWLNQTQKALTCRNFLHDIEPLAGLQFLTFVKQVKTSSDYYIRNFNFNMVYLDDNEQNEILIQLENIANYHGEKFKMLDLTGCRVITSKVLLSLLAKMNTLTQLDITHCWQLPIMTLCEILAYQQNPWYEVSWKMLCPQLSCIHFTLQGVNKTYSIASNVDRKKLCIEMQRYVYYGNYLRNNIMRFLANDDLMIYLWYGEKKLDSQFNALLGRLGIIDDYLSNALDKFQAHHQEIYDELLLSGYWDKKLSAQLQNQLRVFSSISDFKMAASMLHITSYYSAAHKALFFDNLITSKEVQRRQIALTVYLSIALQEGYLEKDIFIVILSLISELPVMADLHKLSQCTTCHHVHIALQDDRTQFIECNSHTKMLNVAQANRSVITDIIKICDNNWTSPQLESRPFNEFNTIAYANLEPEGYEKHSKSIYNRDPLDRFNAKYQFARYFSHTNILSHLENVTKQSTSTTAYRNK